MSSEPAEVPGGVRRHPNGSDFVPRSGQRRFEVGRMKSKKARAVEGLSSDRHIRRRCR